LLQSFLIFALGFLAAAFAAVAIAPAVWQRAVILTRKRIEASVPLTRNELQADKDQQRAEFAMALRRLEMNLKARGEELTKTRVDFAHLQSENSANKVEIGSLSLKLADTEQIVSDLEKALTASRAEVSALESVKAHLTTQVKAGEEQGAAKDADINSLKMDVDSARIAAAAKELELDRQVAIAAELKSELAQALQEFRSTSNQLRAAKEEGRTDKRRFVDADKKIERLTAQIADRTARLERRDEEVERLKDQLKQLTTERNDLDRKLASSERQRTHLESRSGKLVSQSNNVVAMVPAQGESNAALREKIQEIAAKLVVKTVAKEGDKSPIPDILIPVDRGNADMRPPQDLPVSLADRIRALEQSARRN
jgi:chromosome segregation ATPase